MTTQDLLWPAPANERTASAIRAEPATARWLRRSVLAWVIVALLGQAIFAFYVALFYGQAAWAGEPLRWNQVMPRGWVPGRSVDNTVLAAHLLFTVVLLTAGAMQLLPALRRRWPSVHRWTGRTYVAAASVLSLGGLWMLWVRGGAAGDLSQHLAITVNAALILVCAAMAVLAARQRRFDVHRRWALRLFLSASGVWLFRVGLMAWIGLWRAPVGFDPKTFSGPFLTALAWSVYAIVPLLVLEAVLRAQRSRSSAAQGSVAVVLALLTVLTAFGVLIATMGMWGPRMR